MVRRGWLAIFQSSLVLLAASDLAATSCSSSLRACPDHQPDMAHLTVPSFFISHGGGPSFFMKSSPLPSLGPTSALADFFRSFRGRFGTPKAVVLVSAHWESHQAVMVHTGAHPELLFDYYGFPAETYQLKYPAPGSPEIARKAISLLQSSGIPAEEESSRGWDHGVFVPLKLIFAEADVPVVEMSILSSLDPAEHVRIGRALAPLRQQGVMIIGSGFATHNLREVFQHSGHDQSWTKTFPDWLTRTLTTLTGKERNEALEAWEKAPGARQAHPREEHLIPLMVSVGAAEHASGRLVFEESASSMCLNCYQFD